MRFALRCGALLCAAVGVWSTCAGCNRGVSAANAAPNMSPATNRAEMVQWHKTHDKPVAPK